MSAQALQPARAIQLAGVALGGLVLFIAILPFARDPATTAALEAVAAPPLRSAAADDGPTERGKGPSTSLSGPTVSIGPEPKSPRGTRADSGDLARASTVEALRELRGNYPKDAAVLAKLVRAEASANQTMEALGTLKGLIELDEKAVEDKELQGLVVRAAGGAPGPAQDAAFGLMQGPMGAVGVDLLYDLSVGKTTPTAVKVKAVEATKREDTKKLASPATRVAIELRDHGGCDRKAYFAEAERVGDGRCLQFLTPLTSNSGCGLLSLKDCYPCLGSRTELNQAIKAIKDRSK